MPAWTTRKRSADTRTVEAALTESIAPRRFTVFLLGVFAATALLLALIGIYGVIAYSVAQRTHEIGVRMALGAERRAVVIMVVQQGMAIAAVGLVLGVAASLAVTRVMTGLLYEVTPTDPVDVRSRSRRPCRNRARSVLRARVQGRARRPARRAQARVALRPSCQRGFRRATLEIMRPSGPRFWYWRLQPRPAAIPPHRLQCNRR